MSRFEAWATRIATLLVGGTGLVYAWMRYLMHPADPNAFAVINHPLQPFVQHLHILVAPLLVFTAGLMWRQHAWGYWRRGVERHRKSGSSLLLTLVPMVVSGYLIQTTVDSGWRRAWVIVHLVASGLWLLGYMAHQVPRRRASGQGRLASDQR